MSDELLSHLDLKLFTETGFIYSDCRHGNNNTKMWDMCRPVDRDTFTAV